jgi:spore maturation protein A
VINYIWGGLMLLSLVTAFFTGRLEAVSNAAARGASEAVTLSLSLLGVVCFWTGMMNVARESGLVAVFARAVRPLTKLLFPRLPRDSEALDAIVMNIAANVLGMSNAATPFGLKAMRALNKRGGGSATASHEMCMFAVLNSASLQLVPTTVIALRQGARHPFEIIIPVWIVSAVSVAVGAAAAKLFAAASER